MSSSVRHRFFVYAPDKTEPGTLERRLSVREQHLVGARAGHESGFIRIGGMLTTPDAITDPDAPKKMVGSAFILEAESIDQVKNMIENDIYYTSGVWDPKKIHNQVRYVCQAINQKANPTFTHVDNIYRHGVGLPVLPGFFTKAVAF